MTIARTPGYVMTEHYFTVPLNHRAPTGETITVFAREVADPDGRDRPYLLYLQGGPGQESPRPTKYPDAPGWLERALRDYRVLLLDQRGTGLSTPVQAPPAGTAAEQAAYLTHFRADSIVADAEHIRAQLGGRPWSVLGQSFGGFTTLAYLSTAPEGLREAFFTGGLPPIATHPDEIYRTTYEKMALRSRMYFDSYPGDVERVRAIHRRLAEDDVRLPNGDRLTGRRFRQVGHLLGMSDGAERLHYLLERDVDSTAFRFDAQALAPFDGRNPLYSVIHESSYADGFATRWSAERTRPPEFEDNTELFTGEHVYSWMFDEYQDLRPWKDTADLVAEHEWPVLYDADVLAKNEVPTAAVIYADDPYVEMEFSLGTARQVRGLRPWLTNEFEHNGLRSSGDVILDRLIKLARGSA